MDKLTARKNGKAYFVDILKIVVGGLLTAFFVFVILIFRKSMSFVSGKYSALDFTLLFILLSATLTANGINGYKNHRKMPDVMLEYVDGKFVILGEEVLPESIKNIKGRFEFGRTGIVAVFTENRSYKLYGVVNYADVINSAAAVIAEAKNSNQV